MTWTQFWHESPGDHLRSSSQGASGTKRKKRSLRTFDLVSSLVQQGVLATQWHSDVRTGAWLVVYSVPVRGFPHWVPSVPLGVQSLVGAPVVSGTTPPHPRTPLGSVYRPGNVGVHEVYDGREEPVQTLHCLFFYSYLFLFLLAFWFSPFPSPFSSLRQIDLPSDDRGRWRSLGGLDPMSPQTHPCPDIGVKGVDYTLNGTGLRTWC